MSLAGLIGGLVLIALFLAVIAYPFVQARRHAPTHRDFVSRQRERALAYYERVLTNIRDLDEDHATGKIHPDEYQQERAVWVERGVQLLKLLEELREEHDIVSNQAADDAEIDRAIEAQLAAQGTRITTP